MQFPSYCFVIFALVKHVVLRNKIFILILENFSSNVQQEDILQTSLENKMDELIGLGIYSIPEASRLAKVPNETIYRWIRGYKYHSDGVVKKVDPIWTRDIPEIDGENAISFLDLLEIRFISAFRRAGVSWKFIREAALKAQEVFNTTHPFTTQKFRTDGKHIFSSFLEDDKNLTLDLNNANYAMEKIIEPFLYKGLEFESDQVARWYPYKNKKIVIDPERSFGRPILTESGVATDILYAAFETEQDERRVAEWYNIDVATVKSAIDYERGLRL